MGQVMVSTKLPHATPAWLLMPYAAPDACWGCGLEADTVQHSEFRHPMFGRRPNLYTYCADLRDLVG